MERGAVGRAQSGAPLNVGLCVLYTPIILYHISASNSHSDLALVPCRLQSRPFPRIRAGGAVRHNVGAKLLGNRPPFKEKTVVYEIAHTCKL